MAGIKRLRKLQFGKETTAGTAVPATTIWRGTGTLEDLRAPYFPDEDIGYIAPVNRVVIPFTQGQLDLDEVPATFEQLPYILAMGVDGVVTGTKDGAGDGYIYTYTFPTTAAKTPKTYTVEGGDNVQVEQMAYTFCESFKLSGKPKEPWMVSGKLIGNIEEAIELNDNFWEITYGETWPDGTQRRYRSMVHETQYDRHIPNGEPGGTHGWFVTDGVRL